MTLRSLVVPAFLLVSLGASSTSQLPGQAFSRPVSSDRIVLQLQTEDGEATVTVLNGAMARVEQVDGERIGLIPLLHGNHVGVSVVSISRDSVTGAEGVRQLGMLTLTEGRPTTMSLGAFPVTVTWVDTQPPAPPANSASAGPCTTCCVSCGGYNYCGCRVVTDCGDCCCPTTCACPGSVTAAPAGCAVQRPSRNQGERPDATS